VCVYVCVCRSAGVYCMSLLMLFLSHISYLSFYKFDYQLHMTAAVVAGKDHHYVVAGKDHQ